MVLQPLTLSVTHLVNRFKIFRWNEGPFVDGLSQYLFSFPSEKSLGGS